MLGMEFRPQCWRDGRVVRHLRSRSRAAGDGEAQLSHAESESIFRVSRLRNERGARQAHQDVGPCLEAGRTLRDAGQILELREEVGVIQKEAVDGTGGVRNPV